MSEYISKRELIDFLNEEMKQDRPDDLKTRNIQRYIDDAMVDEKEIIRKAMERILKRLKGIVVQRVAWFGKKDEICIGVDKAIEIVKEEGVIE